MGQQTSHVAEVNSFLKNQLWTDNSQNNSDHFSVAECIISGTIQIFRGRTNCLKD